MMEDRIKAYIESVFADVPASERAENIKSEILANLIDKYNDLIKSGKNAEEAYAIAISSGGDLSGIVADLKGENVKYSYTYEKQFDRMYEKQYKKERKKCKLFASCVWPATVCLYFLYSFLVPGAWAYSWIIFIAATATTNLYDYFTIKSNKKKRNSALNGFLWTLITSIYFAVSFLTMRWDITWLIFIIGVSVSGILHAVADRKDEDDDDDE